MENTGNKKDTDITALLPADWKPRGTKKSTRRTRMRKETLVELLSKVSDDTEIDLYELIATGKLG